MWSTLNVEKLWRVKAIYNERPVVPSVGSIPLARVYVSRLPGLPRPSELRLCQCLCLCNNYA